MSSNGNGKLSFPRGVHPPEHKALAEDCPIEVLPTPPQILVPLLQHIGAPTVCELKTRSEVTIGDVIGEAKGMISSPVHSSIAGKTARASVATLPNGRHVPAIPVKAADEQPLEGEALLAELYGGEWPTAGLESHTPEAIADAVRQAGIVGLGGAAFPSHVKLLRNDAKPIDTVLINGCECEPYLTSDYRLMLEHPEPIVSGILLAKQATGATRVMICIEDNKPKAIEAIKNACAQTDASVQVMKTKYPQGSERQLIYGATGRTVKPGGLPLDVGIVVMNISTCAAIARAVLRGNPLTHRVVTVTGHGIRRPANILAPLGAPYSALIDHCGGLTEDAARVIAGGPMMGFALGDLDVPVTKGTSGITVLTKADVRHAEETNCVRCGRCVDVCPMNLVPTKLALAARNMNFDYVQSYHITACMECGSCAYVCPATIPLVQLIRMGKVELQKEAAKAD